MVVAIIIGLLALFSLISFALGTDDWRQRGYTPREEVMTRSLPDEAPETGARSIRGAITTSRTRVASAVPAISRPR